MRMHVLSGGRLRMRRSIFYPGAARDEQVELPVSCFLLRHPQGNVLFDAGCHPQTATDAQARWGGLARLMVPLHGPHDNPMEGLSRLGLAPDDVDLVVCSHLHPDHCGCNQFFRRATVLCHRAELEAARTPGAEGKGYLAVDWDQPLPVDAVDGDRDLFGDGRLVLLRMPGHTPGMLAALVTLERSGRFLLASDTVSVRASLDEDYAPRNTWNAETLLRSLAEIRRLEAAGATVICGHDAAQWETLRKGEAFYE
ncbi:MAG: N-acyl homoserine lactonase family protein [Pseudomonadota bacterium]|nr:N-acyl homoserine lactonase family protein [Pseudomonadota bacterium]